MRPHPSALVPLTFLLAGWSGSVDAQGIGLRPDENEKKKSDGLPAMEMLVKGSILQRIIIPQYDEELRLSSVMRADKLVLVDEQIIDAETVRIEFYHTDQTLRGGIDLKTARLHEQRILRSSEEVTLSSGDLNASGTGIVYLVETSRGFLYGPATAETLIEPTTSMNTHPLRIGAAGISLMAASALHGEGLQRLTEQETTGLDRLSISKAPAVASAAAEIRDKMDKAEAQSKEADKTLSAFLEEAAVEIKDGPKPDLTRKVADPDFDKEIKLPATIKAEEGIYFDSTAGLLVFLDSVVVDHPEFSLIGADEVKVYLEKEEEATKPDTGETPEVEPTDDGASEGDESPETADSDKAPEADDSEPPAAPEKEEDMFGSAKFGDPTRIVATGQVVVERKILKKGDKKAKASGRQMLMDLTTNELIIRGGQPWIISDTANGQVVDPDGYIRLNLKTGDASFVGKARALIDLPKKKP